MVGRLNVLISSAGRRVRLLEIFREALKLTGIEGGVFASDMSSRSSAFHRADRSFLVPSCRSSEFVEFMLDLCRRESISLIIPTIDTELPVYASSRSQFLDQGTVVAVSDPDTVAVGGDKSLTSQWLVRNGLPTVRQASVAEALSSVETWRFPLVAKPRTGSASIGVVRLNRLNDLVAMAGNEDYWIQEYACGSEHTIDFLVRRDGTLVDCVPRLRLETRGGEVSKAITVRNSTLIALTRRIAQALPGAFGCLNTQIFWDSERGVAQIIEINARFGGGFPLAWAAGALYPRWLIEDVAELPSTATPGEWRENVMMLRYDDEVILENAGSIK